MEIANDVLDDQAVRWCLHRFLGTLGNPIPT
jgi:hypothetical protein